MNRIAKTKPKAITHEHLFRWMNLFQTCIRNRDYETGLTLFHQESFTFEANGESRHGLKSLENHWRIEWPSMVQFEFDLEHASIIPASPVFLIACTWSHKGFLVGIEDSRGRGTFCLAVFERGLLCVHAHNSKTP